MTISERKRAMGKLLAEARMRHGVTQYDIAEAVNVSRGTVVNWESGTSNPDIFQIEDFLDFLGEDPIYRLKNYRNPALYDNYINGESQDEDAIDAELMRIIKRELSLKVKQQLLLLFSGEHGRDPDAIMQECNAIIQIPLKAGHAVAVLVHSLYTTAEAHGELNCPDSVKPDMDVWESAILAGFHAAKAGRGAYSVKSND